MVYQLGQTTPSMGGGRSFYTNGNLNVQANMPDLMGQFQALMKLRQAQTPASKGVLGPGARGVVPPPPTPANHGGGDPHAGFAGPQGPAMDQGAPVFTKTVSGPGMMGGTIRLNAWEPGAAFAGYERDLGRTPQASAIQAPGPSAAALGPSTQGTPGQYNSGYQPASMFANMTPWDQLAALQQANRLTL